MRKILVAYASAGAGHFTAAKAIYSYFKRQSSSLDIELVDILGFSNGIFRQGYILGYNFLVTRAPLLWYLAFFITDLKCLRGLTRSLAYSLNWCFNRRFIEFLIRQKADFIICTHFVPAEIAARLKLKRKISAKLVSVITDFGVHPFWVAPGTDYYIVATDYTKNALRNEGVEEKQIRVTGIPVEEKFNQAYERNALSAKLGGATGKFTVMLITGSFGIGPLERLTKVLHRDVQLLVVCGRNKKLFAKLQKLDLSGVKVFGFVDNICELMALSDLVITKPGGLSVAEILAMEIAPIFISAIPGQEAANARILYDYGIGLSISKIDAIKAAVLDFKAHPEKIAGVKANIRRIRNPAVLGEIYNVICSGSAGAGC